MKPISKSCCVEGCPSMMGVDNQVPLYSFPDKYRLNNLRKRWIDALRLSNSVEPSWEPRRFSKLCSNHFVGNSWNGDEFAHNCVPTVFKNSYVETQHETSEESSVDDDLDEEEAGGSSNVCEVSDGEVIEETSDCLFVIEKAKDTDSRLSVEAASIKSNAHGAVKSKGNASAEGNTRSRVILTTGKRKNSTGTNGKSVPMKRRARQRGKKPNTFDLDSEEYSDEYSEETDETSEEDYPSKNRKMVKFDLTATQVLSKRFVSEEPEPLEPERPLYVDKFTQVALPGQCDGFVFSASRDDDFNVGVECNIFYDFKFIPEAKPRVNYHSHKKIDLPKPKFAQDIG